MSFSERMGFTKARDTLQVEGMDQRLRAALLGCFSKHFLISRNASAILFTQFYKEYHTEFCGLYHDTAAEDIYSMEEIVTSAFKEEQWFIVYDLVEFIVNFYRSHRPITAFISETNQRLERAMSAYRLVNERFVQTTDDQEIEAIDLALGQAGIFTPASAHISKALAHLTNRDAPDFANSFKESISAIEAACKIITDDPKATLGIALKKLAASGVVLHPAMEGALTKLYGYTSDEHGIRHSAIQPVSLSYDETKFFLVVCSAFLNLLTAKYAMT